MKKPEIIIFSMAAVLVISSVNVFALTEFKDGETHDIDYEISDDVWVDYQAPDMQTTVNLLDGGRTYDLEAFNDSRINIYGGTVSEYLSLLSDSQVTIFGGSVAYLSSASDSKVTISGGTLFSLTANDRSQVTMSGGTVSNNLQAVNSSQVTISGGAVVPDLLSCDSATLTIVGSDFAIDGTPVDLGEIRSILGGCCTCDPPRWLTGKLANGNIINNRFLIGSDAKIVLTPTPFTLKISVEPNDVGIDTITPGVGAHSYGGRVNIKAQQFVKCPAVYQFDHWEGDVNDPNSANTTVFMDTDKTVTAVFVDSRKCGDECHPYPAGDIDKNCIVDFNDFALFALSWLECTKPECD